MVYPKIKIDLQIIKSNVERVVNLCEDEGISVAGVTKVFCAMPEIVRAYIDGGVGYLADSRIENLRRVKDFEIPKILMRLPMISNANQVVEYSDISFNSEIDTIKALSKAALDIGKIHGIILIVDLGDLREGYFRDQDIFKAVEGCIQLEGINLMGIATNFACFGGLIPTGHILDNLVDLGEKIEGKFGLGLELLSAGNSSNLYLLGNYRNPRINNLRLGESLLLGRETAYGKRIEGTRDDGFILQTEIIEIKEKPSIPEGGIGLDAFGNKPIFVDRGIRKRAICAIGKQDMDFESLHPLDEDVIILGGSSDHLIIDISDSHINYRIGDIIEFKLSYLGILRAMTSEYVKKEIIKEARD